MDKTFEEWVRDWTPIIICAREKLKEQPQNELGQIELELDRLGREQDTIQDLVIDAAEFIVMHRAQETELIMTDPKFQDWSAAERKCQVENRIRHIISLHGRLKNLVNSMEDRKGGLLHARRKIEEFYDRMQGLGGKNK